MLKKPLQKLHNYGSWKFFFLCSHDCPKQPRTSFPFYKFFYQTISGRVSAVVLYIISKDCFIFASSCPRSSSLAKRRFDLCCDGLRSQFAPQKKGDIIRQQGYWILGELISERLLLFCLFTTYLKSICKVHGVPDQCGFNQYGTQFWNLFLKDYIYFVVSRHI